jgi:hypothetical protein
VETINQAIELLTGMEAGERVSDGKFKKGTVNYLVDKRLREFTEELKKLSKENRRKVGREEAEE